MKILLFALLLLPGLLLGQKIPYTVDAGGVHITGVDKTNPVIYDNDMVKDTPEAFYLWLKANRKEVNLVGNISSQNGHPAAQGDNPTAPANERQPALFNTFNELYTSFKSMGGQNVPAPILGSSKNLVNGQTAWENSPGSDLIISEAKKASAAKPLVIFVGGQVTTVANAFLKDRSIGPNIIVFHVDGWGNTQFNAIDGWACQVLIDNNVKYINWDGDANSWYDQSGSPQYRGSLNPPIKRMEGVTFTTINNGFHNLYKGNFSHMYDAYGSIGDGPPVFYFFDHSLWANVVRKNKANQTVTDNNFSYLVVSPNKWTAYGTALSSVMNNTQSYIPVTTPVPPVNNPPSVALSMPSAFQTGDVLLSATASDVDGSVSKVEFYLYSAKVGEDISAPYTATTTLTAGIYSVTAKATDNQGAATTSAALVITVTDAPAPPTNGPWAKGVFSPTDYGAKGDGIQDDGPAFNAAIAAFKSMRGSAMVIQPPTNFYSIRTQVNFTPDASGQLWMDVVAMCGPGAIRWQGQDNSIMFKIVGLKGGDWSGINAAAENGKTGIVIFDIDTTPTAQSTSFNFMRGFYLNLGNRPNNVGFRLGRVSGGNGDVSDYHFENNTIIGNEGGTPQPGQIAFLVEGQNTLACEVVGGFVAWCDNVFSNKSTAGATAARGNSGIAYFTNVQTSQNNIDYSIHFEGTYVITGVRAESSKDVLEVGQGTGSPAITFIGCRFNDYKGNQVATLNSAATLTFINCQFHKKSNDGNTPNPFPQMFVLNSNGNSGTIKLDVGTTHYNNLYTKTGNTVWKMYMEGMNKWSGPHANFTGTTHLQDIPGQILP